MRMANASSKDDDLRTEYDESVFVGGTRGKYAAAFKSGTNIVRLAPDVAAAFPNEQAVNDALRLLQQIAQDTRRLAGHGN